MPAEYESGIHVTEPWHKLATAVVLGEQFDTETALRVGGLDWTVKKEQAERNGIVLPGHFWIVREDNDDVLGHVGTYYTPIQNRTGFEWMDLLLGDESGFHYTDACSLRRGSKVVLTAKAPFDLDFPTSKGNLYIVLILNHDGSGAVQAIATPIQVVCMNTLIAALGSKQRSVKIRHTKNAEDRLANAQQVLGLTRGAAEQAGRRAEELFARKMSTREFHDFCVALAPDGASQAGATRAQATRDILSAVYFGKDYGQPEMVGTAWGALNAAIVLNDHVLGGRDSREATAAENVFERIMNADNFGSKAADLLLSTSR